MNRLPYPVTFLMLISLNNLFLVFNSSINFIIYCAVRKSFRQKIWSFFLIPFNFLLLKLRSNPAVSRKNTEIIIQSSKDWSEPETATETEAGEENFCSRTQSWFRKRWKTNSAGIVIRILDKLLQRLKSDILKESFFMKRN